MPLVPPPEQVLLEQGDTSSTNMTLTTTVNNQTKPVPMTNDNHRYCCAWTRTNASPPFATTNDCDQRNGQVQNKKGSQISKRNAECVD
jgi:hypothetical protein